MNILLIGGSGRLGKELLEIDNGIVAPQRTELDVTDERTLAAAMERYHPDIVIHAAARTENLLVEADPAEAVNVNIKGTANVAIACLKRRVRLVFISTDYVYKGDCGNYREEDDVLPCNAYAWTKLAGEAAVRLVPNHLIIRTSFGATRFPYPVAFQDKWSSKDYVDRIAPMVLKAATSPLTGILNLGSDRKTLYDYARARNPEVRPIRLGESAFVTPYDTSLNLERWIQYQGERPLARALNFCRVCNSKDLAVYLDLGLMPLANNLCSSAKAARQAPRFPLQVLFCSDCYLSQLSVVVDPNILFGYYTYRSSINPSFTHHCRRMAQSFRDLLGISANDLVVDIAGNDGALLDQFRDELNVNVLNIEPAGNIAAVAAANGITTINDFWDARVAERIVKEHQRPKLITATNVFAHVDDIAIFLQAAKSCLDRSGALVLEFPYLVDLITKNEFDTVYFEHLSYLAITPLISLARRVGMTLWKVERQDIHGGSVRVFFQPRADAALDPSVEEFRDHEETHGFTDIGTYRKWSEGIYRYIDNLSRNLTDLKRSGANIAAFGASAKGNTLLNCCRLNTHTISYIVDDTPEKIGKYSPGTGIPIVNRSFLYKDRPDFLLVLAWNFLDDVMHSTIEFKKAGGQYIVPIPEFRVVETSP